MGLKRPREGGKTDDRRHFAPRRSLGPQRANMAVAEAVAAEAVAAATAAVVTQRRDVDVHELHMYSLTNTTYFLAVDPCGVEQGGREWRWWWWWRLQQQRTNEITRRLTVSKLQRHDTRQPASHIDTHGHTGREATQAPRVIQNRQRQQQGRRPPTTTTTNTPTATATATATLTATGAVHWIYRIYTIANGIYSWQVGTPPVIGVRRRGDGKENSISTWTDTCVEKEAYTESNRQK